MATRVAFVGAGSISANHFDSMDELGDASNVLSPFADAVKTLELTRAAVESAKTNAGVELQESLI